MSYFDQEDSSDETEEYVEEIYPDVAQISTNGVDERIIQAGVAGLGSQSLVEVADANLRLLHLLGSSQPIVADHCRDIQQGLLSLSLQLRRNLPQVCIESLDSMPSDEQMTVITAVIQRLLSRQKALSALLGGE